MAESRWWEGRTAVVTGASGYLGGRLAGTLAGRGAAVRLVSRREPPRVGASMVWIPGDVRHPEMWRQVVADADVVFHLAAQTSHRVAERNGAVDFDINVRPVALLLGACSGCSPAPFVVHVGTVTQAGLAAGSGGVLSERVTDAPVTLYDLHKLVAERYLLASARASRCRATALRLSTVYGPGGESSAPDRGVLNTVASRALAGERLTVYGTGAAQRDYLFVDDVLRALVAAAEHAGDTAGEMFVIGSGTAWTIREAFEMIAREAERRTGLRVAVDLVEPPADTHPIELRSHTVDASKFRSATGWHPLTSLPLGVAATLDWLATRQLHEPSGRS